jgi:VanZ family protein
MFSVTTRSKKAVLAKIADFFEHLSLGCIIIGLYQNNIVPICYSIALLILEFIIIFKNSDNEKLDT